MLKTTTGEPLAQWTTLRLGGPAARFVETTGRAELYEAVQGCDQAGEPVLVLGGGSNLVVADAGFDGAAVHVASRGVETTADDGVAQFVVEAGEDWDRFVARCVDDGWVGVEALSGIPGTVGAVPIQNVGAYGQEVSETVSYVHVYDRVEGRSRVLSNAECGFGYRTSLFKQVPHRFVVGSVTFRLRRGELGAAVRYTELARTLGVPTGGRAALADIRSAVLEVRRGKGMVLDDSDHDTWSAGSFFTNPFVPPDALPDDAPGWPQPDGRVKTSAGWLIDHSGFGKGYGNDKVSLSTKHPLALTNRGGARTADLLELAREVRDGVRARYGIELQPEPRLVGCRF